MSKSNYDYAQSGVIYPYNSGVFSLEDLYDYKEEPKEVNPKLNYCPACGAIMNKKKSCEYCKTEFI